MTVSPGTALASPSSLVKVSDAADATGVVSLAMALSIALKACSVALLLIWVVPADTEDSTSTAKVDTLLAPEVRSGSDSTQLVPDADPSAQLHPGVLAPALNVVFAGTISTISVVCESPTPMALLAVSV